MNQADQIEKTIVELYRRENAFDEACAAYVEADHAYQMAYRTAYLLAKGAVKTREIIAENECGTLEKARDSAKAVRDFTKAKLEDCRQVLSARQSILSAESRVHYTTKNLTP